MTSLAFWCLLVTMVTTDGASVFDHRIPDLPTTRPLVIGHRGSSGVIPEHSLPAYERAIQDGADVIECDIVLSRDLVPICNHDLTLDNTTDITDRPEFADRKRDHVTSSGQNASNWFVYDFSAAELQTLKRRQQIDLRDPSFDDMYPVLTLSQHIAAAKAADHTVGIYPELKHPSLHNSMMRTDGHGQKMEDIVLTVLEQEGYTKADDPCFVQCFEEDTLLYLRNKTQLPLVMLIGNDVTEAKLQEWGQIFYGVGAWKEQIYRFWTADNGYKNWISQSTSFVQQAHDAGLKVHVYTFRNEDRYLAWDHQQDIHKEYDDYLKLDVDGYFTDFPATLVRKLDCHYGDKAASSGTVPRMFFGVWILVVSMVTVHAAV